MVTWDGEKFVFDEPAQERLAEVRLTNSTAMIGYYQTTRHNPRGELTPTSWKPAPYIWDTVNDKLRYQPAKPNKPTVSFRFVGEGGGEVRFDGNGDFPPPAPLMPPVATEVHCTREDIVDNAHWVAGYNDGYIEGVKTAAEQARHSIEMLERRLLENRGK